MKFIKKCTFSFNLYYEKFFSNLLTKIMFWIYSEIFFALKLIINFNIFNKFNYYDCLIIKKRTNGWPSCISS